MTRNRRGRWIARRNVLPIEMNARDVYLLDFDEQRVSREAVAHAVVINRDDCKHDPQQRGAIPSVFTAGKVTERKRQQHAANNNYSSRGPVLPADFIETGGAALQACDLFVELLQTSHRFFTRTVASDTRSHAQQRCLRVRKS